jgi:hypothetical protein
MRALPLLLVVACATGGTAPRPVPKLDASLDAIGFFVGSWEGETQQASGKTATIRWTVVPAVAGKWLEGEARVDAMKVEARDFWGPTGGGYVRIYLDSDGTRGTLTSSGWQGTTWRWEGEAHGADGTPVKLRETITRVDDHTMHAVWEVAAAEAWTRLSEETLRRRR